MSFKKITRITRFLRIIRYTRFTGFIIARITRLTRIASFTRIIRFTRCENCKILAKSEYDEQISKYVWTVVPVPVCVWLCENYIEKVQRRQWLLQCHSGLWGWYTGEKHKIILASSSSTTEIKCFYQVLKSSFWVPFHWRSLVSFPHCTMSFHITFQEMEHFFFKLILDLD